MISCRSPATKPPIGSSTIPLLSIVAHSHFPLREGAAFWEKGYLRNQAVGCQKLYGENKKWKKTYGYHKRPLLETMIHYVNKPLGNH